MAVQELTEAQTRLMKKTRRDFSHVPAIKSATDARSMIQALDAYHTEILQKASMTARERQRIAADICTLRNGLVNTL